MIKNDDAGLVRWHWHAVLTTSHKLHRAFLYLLVKRLDLAEMFELKYYTINVLLDNLISRVNVQCEKLKDMSKDRWFRSV